MRNLREKGSRVTVEDLLGQIVAEVRPAVDEMSAARKSELDGLYNAEEVQEVAFKVAKDALTPEMVANGDGLDVLMRLGRNYEETRRTIADRIAKPDPVPALEEAEAALGLVPAVIRGLPITREAFQRIGLELGFLGDIKEEVKGVQAKGEKDKDGWEFTNRDVRELMLKRGLLPEDGTGDVAKLVSRVTSGVNTLVGVKRLKQGEASPNLLVGLPQMVDEVLLTIETGDLGPGISREPKVAPRKTRDVLSAVTLNEGIDGFLAPTDRPIIDLAEQYLNSGLRTGGEAVEGNPFDSERLLARAVLVGLGRTQSHLRVDVNGEDRTVRGVERTSEIAPSRLGDGAKRGRELEIGEDDVVRFPAFRVGVNLAPSEPLAAEDVEGQGVGRRSNKGAKKQKPNDVGTGEGSKKKTEAGDRAAAN